MGVTFSSEPSNKNAEALAGMCDISDNYATLLSFKQCLRVRSEVAAKLVSAYISHVYAPIIDEVSLRSMVYTALKPKDNRIDNTNEINKIINSSWKIFSDPLTNILQTQEMLSVIILLTDAPWNERLFLLFELFKCLGTDEMLHAGKYKYKYNMYKYICFLFPFEYCLHFTFTNLMFLLIIDIQMAAHTCASGLFKLWNVDKWEYDEFKTLTEDIADNAYLKVQKDIEEPILWSHFCMWAQERFKDSRTVATQEALLNVFQSAYA